MIIVPIDEHTFDQIPAPAMEGADCRSCTYWHGKPSGDPVAGRRGMFACGVLRGKLAKAEDGTPMGFIQYGPMSAFPTFMGFRGEFQAEILPDTWVITCIMTNRGFRGRGVARALLQAVLDEAARENRVIEAMGMEKADLEHLSVGPASLYITAGFTELGRSLDPLGISVLARYTPPG
ncbi:MAG: GNAT family N-acetyltransferase [Bacillota bacterium]|nr:GNAT family N-acetyltransferase [Bacillota bacterium]